MSRRLPHWFDKVSEEDQQNWRLWDMTEKRAQKEKQKIALKWLMRDMEERKAI
jgi:hypothetical protein